VARLERRSQLKRVFDGRRSLGAGVKGIGCRLMLQAVLASSLLAPSGDAQTNAATSLQLLKATFRDQITLTTSAVTVLKYCPDNTCEIFRARGADAGEQLTDFALLYLWYLSQYYYLQEWHKGPTPVQVGVARERHSTSCHVATEKARAKCALLVLAKAARIELAFSRYDEGAENEGPVGLADELKRLQ
jgi:hypothetical protein